MPIKDKWTASGTCPHIIDTSVGLRLSLEAIDYIFDEAVIIM